MNSSLLTIPMFQATEADRRRTRRARAGRTS